MPGKIVVIGSSNTDMVIKSQRLPSPGETILGGEFHLFTGGKGANQAVAAARLGGEVFFVARTGNDVFGKQAIEQFTKEGINSTYVHTDPDHPSGVALIMVDEAGENIIAVAPGANAQLKQQDIDEAIQEMEAVDIVLLQLEIPLSTVHYAVKKFGEMGKKVIVNPAPAQTLPEELFKHLYLITPNETEAEILTGIRVTEEETAAEAAMALRKKGVKQVVITLGARGAFMLTETERKMIAAPKVQAVDTTAAGDIFNGALVVAIAQGSSLEHAVNFACQAAAISVTRLGAQASAPYLQELKHV